MVFSLIVMLAKILARNWYGDTMIPMIPMIVMIRMIRRESLEQATALTVIKQDTVRQPRSSSATGLPILNGLLAHRTSGRMP